MVTFSLHFRSFQQISHSLFRLVAQQIAYPKIERRHRRHSTNDLTKKNDLFKNDGTLGSLGLNDPVTAASLRLPPCFVILEATSFLSIIQQKKLF